MYKSIIFQYFAYNLSQLPWYPPLHHESMNILRVFNISLLTPRNICDQLPYNNNVSAKTKWQKGVTQGAASCYLAC